MRINNACIGVGKPDKVLDDESERNLTSYRPPQFNMPQQSVCAPTVRTIVIRRLYGSSLHAGHFPINTSRR